MKRKSSAAIVLAFTATLAAGCNETRQDADCRAQRPDATDCLSGGSAVAARSSSGSGAHGGPVIVPSSGSAVTSAHASAAPAAHGGFGATAAAHAAGGAS